MLAWILYHQRRYFMHLTPPTSDKQTNNTINYRKFRSTLEPLIYILIDLVRPENRHRKSHRPTICSFPPHNSHSIVSPQEVVIPPGQLLSQLQHLPLHCFDLAANHATHCLVRRSLKKFTSCLVLRSSAKAIFKLACISILSRASVPFSSSNFFTL